MFFPRQKSERNRRLSRGGRGQHAEFAFNVGRFGKVFQMVLIQDQAARHKGDTQQKQDSKRAFTDQSPHECYFIQFGQIR